MLINILEWLNVTMNIDTNTTIMTKTRPSTSLGGYNIMWLGIFIASDLRAELVSGKAFMIPSFLLNILSSEDVYSVYVFCLSLA